ncbi:PREDICTED: bcl-2-like protein 15, partial [Chlamydotis macqueenii]|uniref:bcl-2-like protein 15 n=1 Tax=Chlamydotis macqueenii TaxID=187382 RepID=UPI000529732D
VEKFGAAVDSLSRSWSEQNPELVYERAFLCVSVKLLMHVAKKVPAMLRPSQLIEVINGNSQVRNYIEARGGWENLDN